MEFYFAWKPHKFHFFQGKKIRVYFAGFPLSFHHVWQAISMKLSSKSIFRKSVHWALGVSYYLKLLIGGFTNMATLSMIALMAFVRMFIILQKVAVGISTKAAYFSVFVSFCIGLGMAIGNINENNAQFAICVGDLLKTSRDRKAALEKKFLWRLHLGVSILFFAVTVISYTILIVFLVMKRAQREMIVKNDRKNNIMTIKTAFLITGP